MDLAEEVLAVEVEVVEDAGEDVVVVEAGVNLMIKRSVTDMFRSTVYAPSAYVFIQYWSKLPPSNSIHAKKSAGVQWGYAKQQMYRRIVSHYLGDKQDFNVSSKDPSSGISRVLLWQPTLATV